MNASARRVDLMRVADGRLDIASDSVAVEAPLEVRLNGHPFAVIMRTPGADVDLATGFLFAESVIRSAADLQRVDEAGGMSTVNAVLSRSRAEILPDLLDSRRSVVQNSSCGLCGRRTLESLEIERPPIAAEWKLDAGAVSGFPAALRHAQHTFDETGGLHAAGLFDLQGRLQISAEDVGRHNAVDKLLGRMLSAGQLPLSRSALFVSGRLSFEIVQKAVLGGIPLVAGVSAPSSFAVDLARRTGITLLGFVRDDRFNIYAHPERVDLPAHSS
jgi:FdhD protein